MRYILPHTQPYPIHPRHSKPQLLLDTLTSNDFVTVIYFNDKARYTIASSVCCIILSKSGHTIIIITHHPSFLPLQPRLIQATPEAIEDLKNSLDGISWVSLSLFSISSPLLLD